MTRTPIAAAFVCAVGIMSAVGTGVHAQAPAAPTFSKDVAPILFQELHELPSTGRDRADVAAHVRGDASVGAFDRDARVERNDAAVACGPGAWRVPE